MCCGMTKTWTWLGPLAVGVLTSLAAAQSQTPPPSTDRAKPAADQIPAGALEFSLWPQPVPAPIPEELWSAYLERLKLKSAYQVGLALSPVVFEPERERLTEECKRKVTFWTDRWVELMFSAQDEFKSLRRQLGVDLGNGRILALYRIRRSWQGSDVDFSLMDDSESERPWLVVPERLADLQFVTLKSFEIEHPLNRRIEQFEAKNESLTAIVERLCSMTEPETSYAITDRADTVILTMRLRNQSVHWCLYAAASAANWEFDTQGGKFAKNARGTFADVVSAFESHTATDAQRQAASTIETPLDALRYGVLQEARQLEEGDTTVVRLRPR